MAAEVQARRWDGIAARVGDRGSFRRHAAVSSLWTFGVYAGGFITGPILARALGPSGRGDVAAVLVLSSVLTWLVSFGIPLAVSYFMGERPVGELLSTALVYSLVVSVPIVVTLWPLLPHYFRNHDSVTLVWARAYLVFLPLFIASQGAIDVLMRRGAGLAFNFWRTASITLSAAGIVGLAVTGHLTVGSALAANFLAAAAPVLLLFAVLWRSRPFRPSVRAFGVMLPYAWRTAVASAADSVTARLDQLALVALVSPRELGLYAVAVTAAAGCGTIGSALGLALFGHVREEGERAVATYERTLRLTAGMSLAAAGFLALVAPAGLELVFGTRFSGAAVPLRLLLPGQVALNLSNIVNVRLLATGRATPVARGSMLAAVCTVLGLGLVLRGYGIEGAAAVTSAASCLQLLYLRRAQRTPTEEARALVVE